MTYVFFDLGVIYIIEYQGCFELQVISHDNYHQEYIYILVTECKTPFYMLN